MSIELPHEGVGDARSLGVRRAENDDAALRALLAGTGYGYRRVGPHEFMVFRAAETTTVQLSDEVVVTAARRPVRLSELPRSASHLSGGRLEQLGSRDVGDVAMEASGVTRTNLGPGRDKMALRGISDGALTGRAQSTVGLYLNNVRLTFAAPDPDLQLVDVHDVEVLRGPQGALYGAGSLGGVVQIVTNPVDLQSASLNFAAEAAAVDGGNPDSNVELVANAPLLRGRLGVRAVAYDEEIGGWLDNPTLSQRDTNLSNRRGGRLTTRVRSGQWALDVFGVYQTIESDDSQYATASDADVRSTRLLEPHKSDFLTTGMALHVDTPVGELETTTALIQHRNANRYDATGAFGVFGEDPSLARPFDQEQNLSIVAHETRLSSLPSAPAPWFIGVFYADGDSTRRDVLRDGASGSWPDVAYRERRSDAVDEAALFGEVSWRLSPRLTLLTGLRLFQYDVAVRSDVVEPILGLTDSVQHSLTQRGWAPDVRLVFEQSPTRLIYLAASSGYRVGGFNTGGPIGAPLTTMQPTAEYGGDKLAAVEAGTRLTLWQRRLAIDAALFYNRWDDIQTDSLIANGFPHTGNVGDGEAYGLEMEVAFRPSESLTVAGNGLISESDLRDRNPTFPSAAIGGFPGAPDYSAGWSARYERPLSWLGRDARAYVEVDGMFVGRSTIGFGSGQSIGGYVAMNGLAGVEFSDWDLSLHVRNIGDTEGPTFSSGNPYAAPGSTFVTTPPPTAIGMTLRSRF